MSIENAPRLSATQAEATEVPSVGPRSLLERMKQLAASTRGKIGVAMLAVAGGLDAAKKADAGTLMPAEVLPGSQVFDQEGDKYGFEWSGGHLRVDKLEDLNNNTLYWIGFRSMDDTTADVVLPLPGFPPEPNAIIGPNEIPGDGVTSHEMLLTGDLVENEGFFLAVGLEENGNYGFAVNRFLENSEAYIGTSPLQGEPENIDDAIALTDGVVYHVSLPASIQEEQLMVIRNLLSSPGLSGDYNGDSIVDGSDYSQWKADFGQMVTPGLGSDGNSNGIVDAADYTVWLNNLGATNTTGSATASGVPEPGTGSLLTTAAGVAFWNARRRKQVSEIDEE